MRESLAGQPEGWPLIDWLQVRRRGAAPLSRRTVRRRPRTRRRGFERRRRLQTHGASRSRRPHRRRPVPNHRTHPVPESATIWCWNTQATRKENGSRVEGRRVAGRGIGGSSGAFATGPQADSRGHVSSPRSPNPAGRFPAPGSPVESCDSHTGSRSRPADGSRERWHQARTLALAGRCVVTPVDALTTATVRVVPFACACDGVRHSCSSPG